MNKTSKKPLISIVIPAYNSMAFLPETVESVLRQTFTDYELIIVNDGSSDDIVAWSSQLDDPRCRLISQDNLGLSAARNTGISTAKGKYIAFLDADDLWEQSKLEQQVRCFESRPDVGIVHTWMALIDQDSNLTGRVLKSDIEGEAYRQLLTKNTIACPSVMVKRCCFEKTGLFDVNLRSIEDWDMWIRLSRYCHFAVIKKPLAFYRQLPGSMSKNFQVMEQNFRMVIEKAFSTVTPEAMDLKEVSYAYSYICLAWKALQGATKDFEQAQYFKRQAVEYYPQVRFKWEYMRVSLAIALLKWFGPTQYGKLLRLVYSLRRSFPTSL